MSRSFTFGKSERLSHKTQIDALFNEGLTFHLGSFKIIYELHATESKVPVRVLVAVPSKKFRRAVDRNRLRRMIREAYRLHKYHLTGQMESVACSLHVGFVYTADHAGPAFTELEKQMVSCLEKLGRIVRELTC
jgi:ribonuclease P protein component